MINYSNKFKDVLSIVETLSEKEKNYICNGEFKDSPYVIYREVLLDNNVPAAFIDISF